MDHTHDDDDDELIQDEDAVYKKRKCHSDFARKDLLRRLFCDATSAKDAGDITLKFDGFEIGAHESVMSVGTTFFKRGWAQRRGGGSANGSNNTRATMDMTEVLVDMHTVSGRMPCASFYATCTMSLNVGRLRRGPSRIS